MNRREVLALTAASTLASAGPTQADTEKKIGVVLVHGAWHGSWAWSLVEPLLNEAGISTVAIDLPGHGLKSAFPPSFNRRPIDAVAFSKDPSHIAEVPADEFADAVIDGARRLYAEGAEKVVAVGHSMGGVPITFAAAKEPTLFAGLVYVAALAALPNKPAVSYFGLEAQAEKSILGKIMLADPSSIGAFRIDPRSEDSEYLQSIKDALGDDVDDRLWSAVVHLFSTDAPFAMFSAVPDFPAEFGKIKKHYLRCLDDRSLVPETCQAIVDDMNSAWPESVTELLDMQSSHEPMFSRPEELAKLIISACSVS